MWEVPDPVVEAFLQGAQPSEEDAAAAESGAGGQDEAPKDDGSGGSVSEEEEEPASAPDAGATAATEAPAAGGGAAASATATETATVPAAATAAAGAGGRDTIAGMPEEMREAWKTILRAARDEAQLKITSRNAKFERLRQFNKVRARRKKEEQERREREKKEEAEEDAAEWSQARAERSIMGMLELNTRPPAERLSMEAYARDYFNLNRKGLLSRKSTVEKVLSWKDDIIRKPLRKIPGGGDIKTTAIQCFRNITGFMGDRSTGKDDEGHAEKLIKNALSAPEDLRDEVYCQLVKQTTNNPREDSLRKGWKLFGIITGAIAPSNSLEPYLLSYFHDAMANNEPSIGGEPDIHEYAKYALGRLRKMSSLGPRREDPTPMEIEACKVLKPLPVRINLVDGSYEYLPVTSWSTPLDVRNMMCDLLGVHQENRDTFALYELTPTNEERHLSPEDRILDLVAYWQRLYDEEKHRDAKKEDAQTYRFVFKVHMYFEPRIRDAAAERLFYAQAVYDVVSGRYPCLEEDQIELAALQRQVDKPNTPIPRDKMWRYVQAKLREQPLVEGVRNDVNEALRKHRGKRPAACRSEYLRYVKQWKIYGSSFFYCEPHMAEDLPREVFLAVNPKGVLIIDPATRHVAKDLPYGKIPTWGHSGTAFVLHTGSFVQTKKYYFRTEQGKDINDLVRGYVDRAVGAV